MMNKNINSINFISLEECSKPNQRIVILDTETTGLSYDSGDKIVEIGCVELINNRITGKFFQTYINPQRDVSAGAYRVTGISTDFLRDKPIFHKIADDFLKFVDDSILIIHNANFDVPFLNHELNLINKPLLNNPVLDTLLVSRELFPGKPCSLDAVCRRLNIDNTMRTFHGALLDSQILGKVYLMLLKIKKTQVTVDLLIKEETIEKTTIMTTNREKISLQLIETTELDLHYKFYKNKD
jgi:DNA polymerase-3 subunit epsilon